jgi:hypothetical protein
VSLLGRDHDERRELSLEERRVRLERKADVIRSRLLRHVDALDARRHQITGAAQRARAVAPGLLGAIVAASGLLVAGIALVGWAVRVRRRRLLSYRIASALAPFRTPARSPLLAELGRRLLVTVVTVAATELARRGARGALDGRAQVEI